MFAWQTTDDDSPLYIFDSGYGDHARWSSLKGERQSIICGINLEISTRRKKLLEDYELPLYFRWSSSFAFWISNKFESCSAEMICSSTVGRQSDLHTDGLSLVHQGRIILLTSVFRHNSLFTAGKWSHWLDMNRSRCMEPRDIHYRGGNLQPGQTLGNT